MRSELPAIAQRRIIDAANHVDLSINEHPGAVLPAPALPPEACAFRTESATCPKGAAGDSNPDFEVWSGFGTGTRLRTGGNSDSR